MKRKLKITIKDDHNHYALIEQVNNRENEINRGIFLDKDQYEQLRQHFVSGSLQNIQEIIEFLQWAFRKVDKGDTPEETVRMLLMNRAKIDNIKFDSNDR